MDSPVLGALVLGGAILLLLSWVVVNRVLRPAPRNSKIPRGSNGWPLIGETLDFANVDPLEFVTPRVKKYGPVFKSHIVGVSSIIVTTADMAKFVYSERSLFRASYPSTIATLVGKKSLSNCDPSRHAFLKKIVLGALLPDTLRNEVGRLEGYALETLNSWTGKTFQTATEMKEFTLIVAMYFIFGIPNIRGSAEARILVDAYRAMSEAFFAIPINLPGFTWYKALKDIFSKADAPLIIMYKSKSLPSLYSPISVCCLSSKKRACDYLSALIAKSRKDSEDGKPCNSVLRALVVAKDENGDNLGDDEIIDVLIGTLFGAHDTTATSLTWIIKFLTENPDVLKTVVAEHEEISSLKEPGKPLTWGDTRKMPYTQQVIQETLRYPTILQITGRAATEDVEYKGYLIPKGWRVYIMATSIHLDPAHYPSPTNFDPSRFKVAPKPGTYLPFAGGTHICPGNELAKLNMLVFIHHLTTKFRWESLQPDMGTEFKPFPLPKGGYPIKVYRQDE